MCWQVADLKHEGGLAQLARALDLHSRGHRFDSGILHQSAREDGHLFEPYYYSSFVTGRDPRVKPEDKRSLTYWEIKKNTREVLSGVATT